MNTPWYQDKPKENKMSGDMNSVTKKITDKLEMNQIREAILKEREACARIAENKMVASGPTPDEVYEIYSIACRVIAKAIRARA